MTENFTDPQRRALKWLPSDGSWARKPGKTNASALYSLKLYHRDLIEIEIGDFGPRGGREFRYRLTTAGQAKQQELPDD